MGRDCFRLSEMLGNTHGVAAFDCPEHGLEIGVFCWRAFTGTYAPQWRWLELDLEPMDKSTVNKYVAEFLNSPDQECKEAIDGF